MAAGSEEEGMRKFFVSVFVTALFATPAFASLQLGANAPDFSATASIGGKEFKFALADALKKGPVVLYFYPAAFTPGCTIEAHNFAEATDRFNALGATLIGVTAGNASRVAEFSSLECRNKFAVAADAGQKIVKTSR